MLNRNTLNFLAAIFFTFTASMGFAREFIIYSISQNIPMGNENEEIKKNYYVNIGGNQGVRKGDVLDVYRGISRLDPYKTKKRYHHNVKIGELLVLHSEEEIAITKRSKLELGDKAPLFEIEGLMIGDNVKVKISKGQN